MQEDSKSTVSERKHPLLEGWNSPPNFVTYTRIVLVLVFMGLYISAGPWGQDNIAMRWVAAGLFILAASTDKLDGYLARKFDQITELGKLLDPIADKLLICSTLVIASVFHELWWWITVLFLVRELGITIMRFFVIDNGGDVIAASQAGKYKTLFECVGLAMLLLPIQSIGSWYMPVTLGIIMVALILCLYSGARYLFAVFGSHSFR